MDIRQFLTEKAEKTEAALRTYIAEWRHAPPKLVEAISYSLLGGGKRLRPALALGACELISGKDWPALPAACALEMIHTYSLIHDDLPAMDNDDLRRGRPTSHKVYGDALAILAGDGLLTMAFDIAARPGNSAIIRELARAAGVEGMVGGQVLDLEDAGRPRTLDELRRLHACKTGALIRGAVRTGAILGGAGDAALEALTRYGKNIGLAFQIADDILDVVGTEEALGKPIGSDQAHAKSTYPAVLGLERARELAEEAVEDALSALGGFGPKADPFRALARYIIDRDR